MNMIERVAEAVFETWSGGKSLADFPGHRDIWIAAAESAIAAMREPTTWMIDAGHAAASGHLNPRRQVSASFSTMIDEALRDE